MTVYSGVHHHELPAPLIPRAGVASCDFLVGHKVEDGGEDLPEAEETKPLTVLSLNLVLPPFLELVLWLLWIGAQNTPGSYLSMSITSQFASPALSLCKNGVPFSSSILCGVMSVTYITDQYWLSFINQKL